MMVPSLFHAPPDPVCSVLVAQMSRGRPPEISVLFSLPLAKNPIERLSGDQNGEEAPSVPSSCRGVIDPISRINREGIEPDDEAINAIARPSGEIAMA